MNKMMLALVMVFGFSVLTVAENKIPDLAKICPHLSDKNNCLNQPETMKDPKKAEACMKKVQESMTPECKAAMQKIQENAQKMQAKPEQKECMKAMEACVNKLGGGKPPSLDNLAQVQEIATKCSKDPKVVKACKNVR